jgi:hypothetical protein
MTEKPTPKVGQEWGTTTATVRIMARRADGRLVVAVVRDGKAGVGRFLLPQGMLERTAALLKEAPDAT